MYNKSPGLYWLGALYVLRGDAGLGIYTLTVSKKLEYTNTVFTTKDKSSCLVNLYSYTQNTFLHSRRAEL